LSGRYSVEPAGRAAAPPDLWQVRLSLGMVLRQERAQSAAL
jgi:hypothetical protein